MTRSSLLAEPFVQTGVAKRPNFQVILIEWQTHNAWSGCGNSWLKAPVDKVDIESASAESIRKEMATV